MIDKKRKTRRYRDMQLVHPSQDQIRIIRDVMRENGLTSFAELCDALYGKGRCGSHGTDANMLTRYVEGTCRGVSCRGWTRFVDVFCNKFV